MNNKLSIQEARERAGLSLEKVEEETGISVKKLTWYEVNPGELTFDESVMLRKLYGVGLDEVSFKPKKECRMIYPDARRLIFITDLKSRVANILLSITDDVNYSDRHLVKELMDLLSDIEHEEGIITNEITKGLELLRK